MPLLIDSTSRALAHAAASILWVPSAAQTCLCPSARKEGVSQGRGQVQDCWRLMFACNPLGWQQSSSPRTTAVSRTGATSDSGLTVEVWSTFTESAMREFKPFCAAASPGVSWEASKRPMRSTAALSSSDRIPHSTCSSNSLAISMLLRKCTAVEIDEAPMLPAWRPLQRTATERMQVHGSATTLRLRLGMASSCLH